MATKIKNIGTDRTVTKKDGTVLTGVDAQNYGATPTISSANLTPAPAITLPPATTQTGAAGLGGMLETQATQFSDAYTKDLADQKAASEKGKASSLETLLTEMTGTKGTATLTDEAYKQTGGVDQSKTELNDINNQLLQEQEALRKQVERIQTAPGTATASERQREINEVERGSLRKQADLSIIQLARQGKYDSAKAIADRAVAMQLEGQKQKIDNAQFIYEENKDLFSEADKRLFETLQDERKMKYENEEFRLRADYEQKIRENDPKYQAELVKARYDAANPGGSGSGGGTLEERQANALASVSGKIVPGAMTPDGLTILNPEGYINPLAWKDMIQHAPELGLTRSSFIANFGNQLYIDPEVKKPSSSYGLTPKEIKDLGYE